MFWYDTILRSSCWNSWGLSVFPWKYKNASSTDASSHVSQNISHQVPSGDCEWNWTGRLNFSGRVNDSSDTAWSLSCSWGISETETEVSIFSQASLAVSVTSAPKEEPEFWSSCIKSLETSRSFKIPSTCSCSWEDFCRYQCIESQENTSTRPKNTILCLTIFLVFIIYYNRSVLHHFPFSHPFFLLVFVFPCTWIPDYYFCWLKDISSISQKHKGMLSSKSHMFL